MIITSRQKATLHATYVVIILKIHLILVKIKELLVARHAPRIMLNQFALLV